MVATAKRSGLIRVQIPPALRDFVDGSTELHVEADSVRAALGGLAEHHELLINRILTRGGELRPHVNIFVDDADIRGLDGLDTGLDGCRELVVVPSVAGG